MDQFQTFSSEGKRISSTRILAGPCWIVDVKTVDKDGYNAIQLGFGSRRVKTLTRPELGHLKNAGLDKNPPRFLREVRLDKPLKLSSGKIKPGTMVNVADVFKVGDLVSVTGTSKGKGFQGVVKRHHFAGGPRTRGQSDRERAPGSIGQTTTPGRVYKGKKMAGRMGGEKVTVKNLKVVDIDSEKNLLIISGVVPGGRNSFLLVRKSKS